MQFKSAKKKLFLSLLKRTGVSRRLTFQATDAQEQTDILKYFPGAVVVVLPNFSSSDPVTWRPIVKVPGALRCVFISRVAPKKNLLFLLDILRDWPADHLLELTIRGEVEDREYWEKCLAVIRALPGSVTVRFDGPVPNEQVIQVLQEHHVFVLPTFGENFGHAIFEALLAGKPVVISNKTPWTDLEERKVGHDLPLEPAGFDRALRFYASMDQPAYDEWSKAAWAYARDIQGASQLKQDYQRSLFS
jgi:glycosyltransferase involved in cell wall biosynthesis